MIATAVAPSSNSEGAITLPDGVSAGALRAPILPEDLDSVVGPDRAHDGLFIRSTGWSEPHRQSRQHAPRPLEHADQKLRESQGSHRDERQNAERTSHLNLLGSSGHKSRRI